MTVDSSSPFHPDNCRKSVAAYQHEMPSKRLLVKVPCRKPGKQEWFRTHPEWRTPATILTDELDGGTHYLVTHSFREAVGSDAKSVELVACINRQGDVFLWPISIPGPDGRTNTWQDSARTASQKAGEMWVRMTANMAAGYYDLHALPENVGSEEPAWPEDVALPELLEKAFTGHLIDGPNHPVIRRLWGLA